MTDFKFEDVEMGILFGVKRRPGRAAKRILVFFFLAGDLREALNDMRISSPSWRHNFHIRPQDRH